MKAVKFLLLAASAMCISRPRGFGHGHGHGRGHAFGLNKPHKFENKHHPKKMKKPDPKEQLKLQLNDLLEPKYEFLLEMKDKMQNQGLTEEELRGVIKAVPELQYVEEYVDDIMQTQQNGKVSFTNLQEKTDDLTE